jgi:arylsulfatase A-like enzyme
MRVLYIDMDSQRPDMLGCYGYPRQISPNIDRIAAQGVRFDQFYITDAPCLPSRTALWSGRFGFRTGVINHGGVAAQPFLQPDRSHTDRFERTSWMSALRRVGLWTATISPFAERHAAWHWLAGYNEVINTGQRGMEIADDVTPTVLDWLTRRGQRDHWFLHVNYWDAHTPYRTPMIYGNPFEGQPIPAWLTEDVRARQWESYGAHSAQEVHGFGDDPWWPDYPRLPEALRSMADVRRWIDGYNTGTRYMDDHLGRLFNALADLNVLDDTVIMISADHGENQGELGVWGDHQTADAITCRVPLIVRWPGITTGPRVDRALHYHFDWAATLIELLGGDVPEGWDGRSFASAFRAGRDEGRDALVISQGTWTCQRAVRFDDYLCIRTYHDGYHDYPPIMLFDLANDPHEQHNLAGDQPALVDRAMSLLADWTPQMMRASPSDSDPMMTVLREGGPFYTRGMLVNYIERLRATGRSQHAEKLLRQYPGELITPLAHP